MLNKGTALFGGSFNPPTKAHLSVISGAAARFDKVIVMPAAVSPFKPDAEKLSGDVRYGMLKEICAPYGNVEVSHYELDGSGISYTYKTVEHIVKSEPDLYLVIGSDNVRELNRWKNLESIVERACLYVVPRPFFPVTERDEEVLKNLGCRYEIADFSGSDGASTMVPVAVAFGKLREIVPDAVADYVESNGLYGEYTFINGIYDRFGVKQSRREHIYRTVKAAVSLCSIYGVSYKKAITAALLHDSGKYVTVSEMEKMGFVFDNEAHGASPPVEHCYTSEVIARDVAGEHDPEILRAIRLHTTGGENMTTLEKIVFCADYIEEGRTTPNVQRIREKIITDLNGAMLDILDDTIAYLNGKNAVIDKRTIACREWLINNIKKGELH